MTAFSSGQLSIQSLSRGRITPVIDGVSCRLIFRERILTLPFAPFYSLSSILFHQPTVLPKPLFLFCYIMSHFRLIPFFVKVLISERRPIQSVCQSFFLVVIFFPTSSHLPDEAGDAFQLLMLRLF